MDRAAAPLEIVAVVDHRTPDVRGAVEAVRCHLRASLPPGSWVLSVADESTPPGTATAGLDLERVVVVGRALAALDRRTRWATSTADVVAFVDLARAGGAAAGTGELDRLLAPVVAHAAPRVVRRLSRRRTLLALGGVSLTGLLAACSRGGSSASTTPATTTGDTTTGDTTTGDTEAEANATATTDPATTADATTAASTATTTAAATACELTPEMTEGPYYLDLDLVRRDITEGKQGAALPLTLTVLDTATCAPLQGAAVDIWHCDALGAYSGFAQGGGGQGTTFLRGTQVTDGAGRATFDTIYPGWYSGRTVHIHMKVHVSGRTVLTGQLFFDEAVTDAVYSTEPYAQRPNRNTSNEADRIYQGGGARSTLTVGSADGAYPAAMTVGVTVA